MSGLFAALRQLRFPRPIRIEDPGPCLASLDLDELQALLRPLAGSSDPDSNGTARFAPEPSEPGGRLDRSFAAKLATAAWRLGKQAERLGDAGPGRSVRGRVEILTQVLQAEGIEIVDFSGRDLDFGDVWDEIATSAEPKVQPFISAMKAPRVLYRGALVQAGTPIVEDRAADRPKGETG